MDKRAADRTAVPRRVGEKFKKRRCYIRDGLASADEPFVIALNGSQIPHVMNSFQDEVPYPVQAVLPLGRPTVTVDVKSRHIISEGFETRWRILKKSGAEVATSVFLDEAYGAVGGILWAAVHPLHEDAIHPERLAFLHNPKAFAPLKRGWLGAGTEYWVEGNRLSWARVSPRAGAL